MSEFPLSTEAFSGGGVPPAPPPPPPPGLLPEFVFGDENVKMAFTEASISQGVNQRWLGMPRGVYLGFRPAVVSADIVELQTCLDLGVSLLKVGSSQLKGMIDIFTDQPVQLNFTGHTEFPVYIIARSDYAVSGGTNARIFTRATPASGRNEVQLGTVDQVDGDLVVSAVEPLERQTPTAITGNPFGFMSEGAVEDIDAANTMTGEVADARTDLTSVDQPSLSDRVAADMNGTAMADRLSLRVVHLESNVLTLGLSDVPASSLNVSGSFSSVARTSPPFLSLNGNGDETTVGAIAAPTNTVENICPLINAESGERVETADGDIIYGRLSFSEGVLTGTAAFIVASAFVTGTGTLFLSELEVGDLMLGPDGIYYEVAEIISDTQLELSSAFQGLSTSAPTLPFRRFTLTFFSAATGSEVAVDIEDPISLKFFFGVWLRTDVVAANSFFLFKSRSERPTIPDASKTVPGKTVLRAATAQGGALLRVRDDGVTVATNPHTLNFVYPGTVTDLGDGECSVSVPGDTGPTGDPGPVGPTGPVGENGAGLDTQNYFISSGLSGTTAVAGGVVTLVHNVDFSAAPTPMTRLAHLTGGLSYFKNIRSFEIVRIDHIYSPDWNTTRITGEIQARIIPNNPFPTGPLSNTEIKVFLGAFGS